MPTSTQHPRALVALALALALGLAGFAAGPAAAAPTAVPSAATTSLRTAPGTAPSASYLSVLCSTSRYSLPRLRNTSSSRSGTRIVQYALRYEGYSPGPVDGIYGPVTRRAVRAFQRDWGLIVDGVTGPQTWGMLQTLICY